MMIDRDLSILDDIDLDNPVNPYAGLNRGLAAWWKVLPGRNGGSRWWDLLKRNPGVLTNMGSGSGWGGSPAPGGYGSMRFDGTNDYIGLPSTSTSALNQTGDVSLSCWLKTASTVCGLIVFGDNGSGSQGFIFGMGFDGIGGGKLAFYPSNGASWLGSASAVNDNSWHRCGVTQKGTAVTFYVDGQANGTGTGHALISYTGFRSIGAGNNAGTPAYYTNGQMDDIKIYSRALTTAEMYAEYIDALLGNPSTLSRFGGLTAGQQAARIAAMNHMLALNARRAS